MTQRAEGVPESIIAFVDLLGTKEFSHNEPRRFEQSLATFTEAVKSAASVLDATAETYYFSDCLYFETQLASAAAEFLSYLRGELMVAGFYLKAGVRTGTLGASESGEPTARPKVSGTTFRGNVVDVYAYQDSLKGAGIRVADDVANAIGEPCVRSCHLPFPNSSVGETFTDLRLRPEDLSEEILDRVLKDFFVAATRSKKFGRNYISLLSTWVRSSMFSVREGKTHDRAFLPANRADYVVDVFLGREFERHFGTLTGIEYVYYALLDELFTQNVEHEVRDLDRVIDFFCRRKKLITKLESVSTSILDRRARNDLLKKFSSTITIAPGNGGDNSKTRGGATPAMS